MENANFDPRIHLAKFQEAIAGHISDFRNTLRTIEDDSYIHRSKAESKTLVVNLAASEADLTKNAAIQRACRRHFLSIVGDLITYVDWLIAAKNAHGQRIPGVSTQSATEEIRNAINDLLYDHYRRVAADTRLTNPAKIKMLGDVPPWIEEFLLSLFSMRRAMEHHSNIPDKDISISYRKIRIAIGTVELREFPISVEGGQSMSIEIAEENRLFPADRRIELGEEDLECLFFTLQALVGPVLVKIS